MGNKQNKEFTLENNKNYGEIELLLDNDQYFQGEQVNGIIRINLLEDFPDNKIQILVMGYEENLFYYNYTKEYENISNSNYITCKDKNIIYKKVFTVFEDKNTNIFNKGTYDINFSFLWLDDLNGSFYKEFKINENNAYGKIHYFIMSGLSTSDKKINFLSDKKILKILEKPKEKTININELKTLKFNYCYCINLGKMNAFLEIDKNNIIIGDEITVKIVFDNSQNKFNIENLYLLIYQKLKFYNNEYSNKYFFEVLKKKLPEIKAKEKITEENPLYINIDTKFIKRKECSITSDLIVMKYFIKLVFERKIICKCHKNPYIKLPINIYNEKELIYKKGEKSKLAETCINQSNFEPITLSFRQKKKKKKVINIESNKKINLVNNSDTTNLMGSMKEIGIKKKKKNKNRVKIMRSSKKI